MPLGEALDDDLVASILSRDANAASSRGFPSLLDRKPRRKDAPKPNTRFLRNLVRDADSQNAALKIREEAEAQAKRSGREQGKRKRDEGRGDESRNGEKRRRAGDRPGRWASVLNGLDRVKSGRCSEPEGRGERRREERSQPRERRHRSRSPGRRRRHHRRDHLERHSRARSPPPPDHGINQRRRRSHSGSDTDPLDDLIGPAPPPVSLPRGRGANQTASASSIDTRFRPDYDPKTDIHASALDDNGERDDWDMALEALRDRAKWKSRGAERLKAAGFTDEEARRRGDGGREKDERDVRWRKKGEGREWDRGKLVGEDGVEVKAEWAR